MAAAPSESLAAWLRRSEKVCGVAVIDGYGIAWTWHDDGGPDRLFQAGSISKPVTALAALELAAQGEVDLDADVNERLSSWQLPGDRGVSLRQLLGHTSGMGIPFFPGYPQGSEVPALRQVLDGVPPSATPAVRVDPAAHGTFRYSGGGYAVIQQLIADVTGVPFAQAAHELVLAPLGMTQSTFSEPLTEDLHARAARPDWHVYPEAAAAGLWTTPDDLARYVCAVAAAWAGREPAKKTGPVTQMLRPHARLPAGGEWSVLPLLGLRCPDTFGLGMFLHGNDRFSHFGGAASFFSGLTGSKDGTGAVVMTAANASPFLFKLLRRIGDEQGWAGFRQPGWRRLQGLRGLRHLT
jgi:CubicO group peptidase (beta-lactamase class C family)